MARLLVNFLKSSMLVEGRNTLQQFWCIGISYLNSSTEERSEFAVNAEAYEALLERASDYGVSSVFVLSTCNRTEIYGLAKDPTLLMALLCSATQGNINTFKQFAYSKQSTVAVQHLFNVAGGIESQILGDYEIVGQLKTAFNFSKSRKHTCGFIDRLFSTVLQSSRAIRTKTSLSSGTVSVAYAAVQFLKDHFESLSQETVLVIGAGEIGGNFCKNLHHEFPNISLSLTNRTEENAISLAEELSVPFIAYTDLEQAISDASIVVVATNAKTPILLLDMVAADEVKTIIDLSIPNNVSAALGERATITLANVDDLSKINDATLVRREAEVPKVKGIIAYYIHEFAEWYMMRQNVPVLKAAKEKIKELNEQLCPLDMDDKHFGQKVQKVLNSMAVKLKEEHTPGCTYLEAMSSYCQTTTEVADGYQNGTTTA